MKGIYTLLIELDENKEISIGKIGDILFKKGFYVYVGSALNGLENRIDRHLRKKKKTHWHIDYFLDYATVKEVFYKETKKKEEECDLAKRLDHKLTSIDGFGSSDCKCESHLFYGLDKYEIESYLKELMMQKFQY